MSITTGAGWRQRAQPNAADERESPFSRFFEFSTEMLCLAGVDGHFKVLNRAWSETLGYSNAELLARPYLEFVHPDDHAATVAEASKIADGFATVHFRNRYRCKDGSYKWLAWMATPAMADGMIYATARDVTNDVVAEEAGMRKLRELRSRVQGAMASDAIRMVFQPIVDLATLDAAGYEALARFEIEPIRTPDKWFEDAGVAGLRAQLELRAIRGAVARAEQLPERSFLSLNASPEALLNEDFGDAVADLGGTRVVVEVTENAAVEDYEPLQKAVGRLRQRGIRLAIDDTGAGYASLKHIVRLVPDFIKLDIFLIRDIDAEPLKRAVVAAMAVIASEVGAELIAEGVENARELKALHELNVHKAQGFYFGRPGPLPRTQ